MKLQPILIATSLIMSLSAHAAPPADVLKLVQAYDSNIVYSTTKSSLSATGCGFRTVTVTGADPLKDIPANVYTKEYIPPFAQGAQGLKSIVLLPPTGGENILDDQYANEFCHAGFRVIMLTAWDFSPTPSETDLGVHDRGAIRALTAVRHVVEYLEKTGTAKVGIFGTSVGALTAELALGVDPRIESGVFIVGGLGIADIIATSDESGLTALRNERMSWMRLDAQGYKEALEKSVRIEPGDFIGYSGPKKIFSVMALNDTTVPTVFQEKLYEDYGRQLMVPSFGDHKTVIILASIVLPGAFTAFFGGTLGFSDLGSLVADMVTQAASPNSAARVQALSPNLN
jgi:dienelactone hydrolase